MTPCHILKWFCCPIFHRCTDKLNEWCKLLDFILRIVYTKHSMRWQARIERILSSFSVICAIGTISQINLSDYFPDFVMLHNNAKCLLVLGVSTECVLALFDFLWRWLNLQMYFFGCYLAQMFTVLGEFAYTVTIHQIYFLKTSIWFLFLIFQVVIEFCRCDRRGFSSDD